MKLGWCLIMSKAVIKQYGENAKYMYNMVSSGMRNVNDSKT